MATVTGLSKERMLEIEAASVVDGHVDGSGHLILEKFDTTEIDAGSVIGPQGPQGTFGPAISFVGVQDLDTYLTSGLWAEGSNANAAAGAHYPEPYAGLLEVFNRGTSQVYQRYTTYVTQGTRIWSRSYSGGVWGSWRRIPYLDELADTLVGNVSGFAAGYGQPTAGGPRQQATVVKGANGKYKLAGTIVNTVTGWSWSQNVQYSMGSVPAAAIPPFDVVGTGLVNIPATGLDLAHFIVRGSAAGSPFGAAAGVIVWQPVINNRAGLSVTAGTLTWELPQLEW